MIAQEQIRAYIERLIHLAMTRYVGANGLVYNSFDSRTGARDATSLVRDLGDYDQYIAWAGKLLDRPDWVEWAVRQVALAEQFGANWRGLVDSFIDTQRQSPRHILPWSPLFPAWHDDLLLGLVELYRISGQESILHTITNAVDGIRALALRADGCVAAAVLPMGWMKVKVAEEFVEVARLTGRSELVDDAERMIRYWISGDFFRRHGLVPDNDHVAPDGVRYPLETLCLLESVPRAALPTALICRLPAPLRWLANRLGLLPLKYLKRGRWKRLVAPTSTAMKSNTLLMFGLLEVMRERPSDELHDAFMTWFGSIEEKLACPKGGYYTRFHAVRKTEGEEVCLGHNFALTEVLIEGYVVLKHRRLLDAAVKVADFWLGQRFRETGLLREYPFTGWEGAVLDSNTDMAVNYLKLAELTEEDDYLDAAADIAEGINTHLWSDGGLYTQCNGKTGGRTQSGTDYTIKIKWNLLHLKLLLLLYEAVEGRHLLSDPDLWKLARDR